MATNTTNTVNVTKSASNTDYIVIGKIPGYNYQINNQKVDENKIDYTNRLRNNLTTIKLRPTGYYINFDGMASDIKNKFSSFFTSTVTNENTRTAADLYKIGETVPLGQQLKRHMPGTTALQMWQNLLRGNVVKKSTNINELRILATNDSTMTEVFGNNFDTSSAEKVSNKIQNIPGLQFLQTAKKTVTIDSSLGLKMLEVGNRDSNLLSIIEGKAVGIQTALPKEWVKSDYTNSLQIMVKLISPSGDPASIDEYILKPLKFLILAVSPATYDGITFGYPTLWEVEADGMMDIKLAGISAMTITRGGNETQFNRFNQPLNVDVRLTIEPLINGFSTLANGSSYSTSSQIYKNFLVTNPGMLDSSMEKDEAQYQTIKL